MTEPYGSAFPASACSTRPPVGEPLLGESDGCGRSLLRLLGERLEGEQNLPEAPLRGEQYAEDSVLRLHSHFPDVAAKVAGSLEADLGDVLHLAPEVGTVVTQLGRVGDGLDPWTPSHIAIPVTLRYDTWPSGNTKQQLVQRMRERISCIPGIAVGFSQPMIDMVNDKVAGAHSELVVKLFGENLGELRTAAERLADVLKSVSGAADVAVGQEPPLVVERRRREETAEEASP